jgi:hypothetical protein
VSGRKGAGGARGLSRVSPSPRLGAEDTSTEESGTQPGAGDTSAEESGTGREGKGGLGPGPGEWSPRAGGVSRPRPSVMCPQQAQEGRV